VPKGLSRKATGKRIEDLFAVMPEGRVTDIVTDGDRLRQIGIEPEPLRNCGAYSLR